MNALRRCLLAGLLLGILPTPVPAQVREEPIQLEAGTAGTTVAGEIQGEQRVDYEVKARAGQWMRVVFAPSNPAASYEVLPPGSDTALFVGSVSANRFDSALPVDGAYRIRVYLRADAARRNEGCDYTLDVSLTDAKSGPPAAPESLPARDVSLDQTFEPGPA